MDEADVVLDAEERVFGVRGARVGWWVLGGVLAFGAAGVGFGVRVRAPRGDQLSFHLITTLPAILGVGALMGAWARARTPREVGVGADGVRIEWRRGTRMYRWEEVGWSTIQMGALNSGRRLKLYDAEGRAIANLSEAIEDFDTLAELIKAGIAAKGGETAGRVQMAKAKRSALFVAGVGVAMLGVSGAVAWNTHRERRAERLLGERAVEGDAEIVRRFLAPNGVTPRLEYRITTAEGRTATRNAEMERGAWDELEGETAVEVRYVPEEPGISRLASGEAEERDLFKNPVVGYGLPAVMAVVCVFFLIGAALMWLGWDIDFDSKTGRISIKRFGEGR